VDRMVPEAFASLVRELGGPAGELPPEPGVLVTRWAG